MSLNNLFSILKGGAGSGNIGHAGRIGHRGGSAPKGGSSNPLLDRPASGKLANILGITEDEVKTMLDKAFSYKDEETGYMAVMNDLTIVDDRSIGIHGSIRDKNGNRVGQFQRTINPDKSVHHDYFEMDEGSQGSGFGSRFYKNAEDAYKEAGVKRVVLTANETVGGYAWARMGFDFAHNTQKFSLNDKFSHEYRQRYGKMPTHTEELLPYEMAAYVGPDGHRLGKDVLLGSQWDGVKNLSDTDLGYQVGKEYYASKGK